LKLKAWDIQSKELFSTSTAINEDNGELEDESEGEGWWQEARSQTITLVVRVPSTCKSVTGEGSGFRGASSTGGKPGVRVHNSTNSGDMCEDPGPNVLKHILGRALESQRTKEDCREAMKTIFNE
jgi:hypothetical protein